MIRATHVPATLLQNPDAYTWRPLAVLSLYRVIIVGLITALFLGAGKTPYLETENPQLFLRIALAYLILSVVAHMLVRLRRPGFPWQIHGQISLDIIAIGGLIYASGTLGNGLGALMAVAVAGGSILTRTRIAILFAAIASLLLLGQQVYTHLETGTPGLGYTQAGAFGIAIFGTAILSSLISRRARENQALADRRGVDLASMEALNAHIVQEMDAGVIALTPLDEIRLINPSARKLLGRTQPTRKIPLAQASPALAEALSIWRESRITRPVRLDDGGAEVRPRFLPLGANGKQGMLIMLEDLAALRAQVQQEKLASLGHLTANIAHEIRNPLSAISHAAQLLLESPALAEDDARLVKIVRRHGQRINDTVDNVLQLSRRRQPQTSRIALKNWLEEFAQEFQQQPLHRRVSLTLRVAPETIEADFDPSHLYQILSNLCANAVRHSGRGEQTFIALEATLDARGRPFLEISDNGKGIPDEVAARLFEPFHSTAAEGTGLGLYLCRELCESNRARLTLVAARSARFRLSFAGPEQGDTHA